MSHLHMSPITTKQQNSRYSNLHLRNKFKITKESKITKRLSPLGNKTTAVVASRTSTSSKSKSPREAVNLNSNGKTKANMGQQWIKINKKVMSKIRKQLECLTHKASCIIRHK